MKNSELSQLLRLYLISISACVLLIALGVGIVAVNNNTKAVSFGEDVVMIPQETVA
ncbi:MAG: hypothetical protein GX851_08750 [Clostridiales bacterium]|jgi:hypothetical protein|nr:hypothetical protein [Clostridiales bacterium]